MGNMVCYVISGCYMLSGDQIGDIVKGYNIVFKFVLV